MTDEIDALERDIDRLAVWAVRYALGRMTYAVADVTEVIERRKDALAEQTKAVIVRDIEQAPGLGMEMDAERWRALSASLSPRCSHWPGQTRCEVCGMGTNDDRGSLGVPAHA